MLVKDMMATDLVCVAPNRSVADASGIMAEHRIRHLPVVDEEGQLLGPDHTRERWQKPCPVWARV
jgi:acetoin utilization protein AcuB